jgi:hypothetical protein
MVLRLLPKLSSDIPYLMLEAKPSAPQRPLANAAATPPPHIVHLQLYFILQQSGRYAARLTVATGIQIRLKPCQPYS